MLVDKQGRAFGRRLPPIHPKNSIHNGRISKRIRNRTPPRGPPSEECGTTLYWLRSQLLRTESTALNSLVLFWIKSNTRLPEQHRAAFLVAPWPLAGTKQFHPGPSCAGGSPGSEGLPKTSQNLEARRSLHSEILWAIQGSGRCAPPRLKACAALLNS